MSDDQINVPAELYLKVSDSNQSIFHSSGHGGFGMMLAFRSLLRDHFEADDIVVHLLAVNNGQQVELELSCASKTLVKGGTNRVHVTSKVR